MSLKVSRNGGASIEPVPEGSYIAICVGVYDIGVQKTEYKGEVKESPKLAIIWELPEEVIQGGSHEGEPRLISKMYTASLGDRSNLKADLESWRGRAFTDEEMEGFDLVNILGKACMVQIIHSQNNGRTYANIKAVTPVYKGVTVPQPANELKAFDLDSESWLWELDHGGLPEWIVKKVKESETYKNRMAEEEIPEPLAAGAEAF